MIIMALIRSAVLALVLKVSLDLKSFYRAAYNKVVQVIYFNIIRDS
jgi:hypothetical protein